MPADEETNNDTDVAAVFAREARIRADIKALPSN
jgi:hypothetical protein